MKLNRMASLLSCGLLLAGSCMSVAYANTKTVMHDTALNNAVTTKLAADPMTSASDIKATTMDGVVTLTGTVKTDQEVDVAVQHAESIDGVSDVDSKIMLTDSKQPMRDSIITAKVKGMYIREKLFGDKPVSVMSVNVETKDGVVHLMGTVDTKEQAHNAVRFAKKVTGVKHVDSKITIVKPAN